MKLHLRCLLLPVMALLALSSCVEPTVSGNPTGPRSYTKLPASHKGSAYYHQGRYYTGGQHQTGSFTYQGRSYTSRYFHDGQYYYGGEHKFYPGANHNFQQGDFPAGNYTDGNYQGSSWNSPNGN